MKIDRNRMSEEENAMIQLHSLYRKYGYSRYKMGKFEEYELYLKNKDFIQSDSIVAFSDGTGRLMALKPDLTLSIVKNYRYQPGYVEKIFYSENIYRAAKESGQQREIMQTGLECLGDIDTYQIAETAVLAASSLEKISRDYILEISHMGVILDVIRPADDKAKADLVEALGQKNMAAVRKICEREQLPDDVAENIGILTSTYGPGRKVLKKLESMELGEEGEKAVEELRTIMDILKADGLDKKVRIDFSIVNDMKYYSGVLFKGFVKDVPKSVLSGGQYDRLMKRMGKKGGAIGFAVYLDTLELIHSGQSDYDVSAVLLYDKDDDPEDVAEAARKISSKQDVLIEKSVPDKLRFRELYKMKNGEAEKIG